MAAVLRARSAPFLASAPSSSTTLFASVTSLFSFSRTPSSSAATTYSAYASLAALPWLAAPLGALAGLRSLLELLPPVVLAVPKSKISHSRKSMRSANKGLKNKTNLTHCEACGTLKLAHNVCPTCYSEISRRWKKESRAAAPPKSD